MVWSFVSNYMKGEQADKRHKQWEQERDMTRKRVEGYQREKAQDISNPYFRGNGAPSYESARVEQQQSLGNANRAGQQQSALAQSLQAIAAGQQLGPASQQFQSQMNAAAAQRAGMAGLQANTAAGARMAARQNADMAVQANPQAQAIALDEQAAARSNLAATLQAMRQADQSQYGMGTQGMLGYGQMANRGDLYSAGYGMDTQMTRAQALDSEQDRRQELINAQYQQLMSSEPQSGEESAKESIEGGLGIFSSIISDRRAKKNIKTGGDSIGDMLKKLRAYDFEYKDKSHGGGTWSGVMAQDLEKSERGREIVQDSGGVKSLDGKKALSAALAAVAQLDKRIAKMEASK